MLYLCAGIILYSGVFMDEKVIFSKSGIENPSANNDKSNPLSVPDSEPVVPVSKPVPAGFRLEIPTPHIQPELGVGAPASSESPPLPPKPPLSSFFSQWGKIISIVIGIGVILALVIFLILPRIGKKAVQAPVTLTYWGLFEEKRVMDTIIADFQVQHPTISVNFVQKDVKEYRRSLVTQLENGNGPDIFRFHNSWVGMMKSYLSPMTTEVISADEIKKNYYPVIQQDLIRNGALYGLPLQIDTLALFINNDLFEAGGNNVPKTWDEFVRVSKELVVKDEDGKIRTAGAGIGTYDNIHHAPDIVALLMAQNGVNFSDFSSTKTNASQALEFYTAFTNNEGSVWDSTLDPSLTAFAKGNLAMYFGYSWDIFALKALSPDLRFSIAPVPNLPGRQKALASYWVEGISSRSKHQKEAQIFMQFLAKKETLQKLYTETAKTRSFGQLYPRSDMAQSLSGNSFLAPFLLQASYATSSYFASDTYDDGINQEMNVYLGNAVRGSASEISSQTAIDTLDQGVNQLLTKYGR